MAPTTRRGPKTPVNNTNPNNMTPESIQAMIDQDLLQNSTNGDGSHSSHGDKRRNVQTTRPCFYADFMECQPLNFKGTEGVVGLTRWIEKMESVFNISGCAIENQVKFATCTLLGAALTWWNGTTKSPATTLQEAECRQGLQYGDRQKEALWGIFAQVPSPPQWPVHPEMPQVQQSRALLVIVGVLHFQDRCPKLKNKDGEKNAQGWVYAVGNAKKRGNALGNPDANVVTERSS
ncbi:hypothetical protein Tco_1204544 [Tanacetum coccineum]